MKVMILLSFVLLLSCQKNQSTEYGNLAIRDQKSQASLEMPAYKGHIDSQSLKVLMLHYFTVKNALVDGNARGAAQTAREISNIIAKSEDSVINSIIEHFELIGKHEELNKQRTAFYPLSAYMYAVTSKIKPDTASIYKQFCPMAFDDTGAFWLSDEEEIYNPYFGEEMLQCGMVQNKY